MKRILLISSTASTKPDFDRRSFPDALHEKISSHPIIDISLMPDLVFDLSVDGCKVFDVVTGNDIASYNLVIIRSVGKSLDQGIALAHYLRMKNVPFIDSYLEMRGAGKLSCAMQRFRLGLVTPTPRTIYADPKHLEKYINEAGLNYPIVLKANISKKSHGNYLIMDSGKLDKKLARKSDIQFVVQEYIPNDGVYRVLVFGGKISVIIKRSQASIYKQLRDGLVQEPPRLENVDIFDENVKSDILKAVNLEALDAAGVDIIISQNTGKLYILEVNRAPQINGGSFINEKITAYAAMIDKKLL
ncbi:MAG: hypothetical protein WA087_01120 [Candidatus Saccharimonadales bacterium]